MVPAVDCQLSELIEKPNLSAPPIAINTGLDGQNGGFGQIAKVDLWVFSGRGNMIHRNI